MSYILDALRRADAERSRGAVPGLHAQSVPADAEPAARNFRPLIWAAGGAGALLVTVVVLVFAPWRGHAPAVAPDARVAASPLAPAPELAPAPAPRDAAPASPAPIAPGELPPPQPGALDPAARPVEPPMGRAAYQAPAPAAYPPPQSAQPTQVAPPTRDILADRAANGRVATLQPPPSRQPAQPPVEHYGEPLSTPQAAAAAATAVPNINDLAPNVRSQLPRLTVGGSIYSDTPSARMVILNGQVFHEGEKPAADTVLEQIHPKSAVFNFRGQRYLVTF